MEEHAKLFTKIRVRARNAAIPPRDIDMSRANLGRQSLLRPAEGVAGIGKTGARLVFDRVGIGRLHKTSVASNMIVLYLLSIPYNRRVCIINFRVQPKNDK